MRTSRQRSSSDCYHVVARGVGKQLVFEDARDRLKFLELMASALRLKQVSLYAYCLMDNYIHLLVRGNLAALSSLAGLLFGAYAQWFNLRHGRSGHLFQNRYFSEGVESDAHCAVAVRYIHLNPFKAGLSDDCAYRWSSYTEYVEKPRICDTEFVLNLLGGKDSFTRFYQIDAKESFFDIGGDRNETRGMPDSVAYERARSLTGLDNMFCIASYDKSQRNEVIRRLKLAGITVRQIERLTGIPKSAVHRA